MKSNWVARGFHIALLILIVVAGFGQAVHQLWNQLMPEIFGLPLISFWQSVGLMALSWLLFGGLGMLRGRPIPMYGPDWRRRVSERLEQMPPEERERFRQGLHNRCGRSESPGEAAPKA